MHAQSSPLRVSHNRHFPRGLPSSLSLCMLHRSPPSASPRARSMVPFSCRGSIVPCTVASLTGLPPSLPSCMCPFPCQSVLPPMTLYRPLTYRSPIVPTNPVNVPSFPQTPSILHRFLHCPLPHWSTIAPAHPRQCSFLRRRPLPRPRSPSPIEAPSFVVPSLPSPTLHSPFPCPRCFRRSRCTISWPTGLPSLPHTPVNAPSFLSPSSLSP